MSDAREGVLAAVRRSLRRGAGDDREARARIAAHPRGPVPLRGRDTGLPERLARFQAEAERVNATLVRLAALAAVPAAVADYLKQHNLPPRLKLAPDPDLAALPWAETAPLLEVTSGPAEAADRSSLTGAFAAVAESGTLVLRSAPTAPTALNFLPENHLVVLRASQIVGAMEDVWDRLREAAGGDALPRTVNFITGPSRTGDIEQRIELGAHGPRRLHLLLVDDAT